jgi:hypothetical protein
VQELREFCCNTVGSVFAQSSTAPSVDEINQEIQALGADRRNKQIPEGVLRRWFPNDDLDDNAATLQALGFKVRTVDTAEIEGSADPSMELERRVGTKKLLVGTKILSTALERLRYFGVAYQIGITIAIDRDGRRKLSGDFGADSL